MAAAPGDEIVLGAGTHAGPVTLDRALTLRGEPGDFTVPPPLTIAHALMRAWLDL